MPTNRPCVSPALTVTVTVSPALTILLSIVAERVGGVLSIMTSAGEARPCEASVL